MNGNAESGRGRDSVESRGRGRRVVGQSRSPSVVPYRLDTEERAENREECPGQCSEVVCWLAIHACGSGVSLDLIACVEGYASNLV